MQTERSETRANALRDRRRPWLLRLVVVFVGAVVVWRLVDLGVSAVIAPGYTRPGHVARAVATTALTALLIALLLRWEGRHLADYGIRLPSASRDLGLGALGYLVPCVLASVVVLSTSLARLDLAVSAGELVLQVLSVLVLVLLFEAIPEELVFRGYLYGTLRERLPSWLCVLAKAVGFCVWGALIGAGASLDRQVLFFVFAVGLGLVREATGSVLVTVGFHAAFQTVSQLLLGGNWGAVELTDPQRWFSDVAVAAPLLLGPLLLVIVARRRPSAPDPTLSASASGEHVDG